MIPTKTLSRTYLGVHERVAWKEYRVCKEICYLELRKRHDGYLSMIITFEVKGQLFKIRVPFEVMNLYNNLKLPFSMYKWKNNRTEYNIDNIKEYLAGLKLKTEKLTQTI